MERKLTSKMMRWTGVAILLFLVLATPLLYYLTTKYYAEDLTELVVRFGVDPKEVDLQEDVFIGMFIQFFMLLGAMLAALWLVMRLLPQRLWQPFEQTLQAMKSFRVEKGTVPLPQDTGTEEFTQLNRSLTRLMDDSVRSYRVQKEFTENASHELQTPLAIALNKIDLMQQDESLTEEQARSLQEIQQELHRMSTLSRSLLLLSKIDNKQFGQSTCVNLCDEVRALLPSLESLTGEDVVRAELKEQDLCADCNETLLHSLITNLTVNAVRYHRQGTQVVVSVADGCLTVSNASDLPALDPDHLFTRFYGVGRGTKGNGLGLSIIKAICDYYGWPISYRHEGDRHTFQVVFTKT